MPEPTRPDELPRLRALLASARMLVRRHRLWRWATALTLGLVATIWLTGVAAEADRRRAAWSTTESVWVLTRDLPAGRAISGSDLTSRTLPVAAVPPAALPAAAGSPVGRPLRVDGHVGEIILGSRLAPDGASAISARLPAGTLGLSIPTDDDRPFEIGDTADVFDLVTGRRLAERAPVVATAERAVTVAVEVGRTGSVIAALADGGVVLGLRP